MKDESIDDEATYLEVFLFSFDDNGNQTIPEFNPDSITVNKDCEKKFQAKMSSIISESSLDNQAEFILEPLSTQNEVIFRIIDTKFTKPRIHQRQ